MDVCLIECQHAIDISLAVMMYLGILILAVFCWNRFAARKSSYGAGR